ncbi:hypothetical protein Peetri_00220 [Pseudomonas phage vB_PpuM-Peetri]
MNISYRTISFSTRFPDSGGPIKFYFLVVGKVTRADFTVRFTYECKRNRVRPTLKFHNSVFLGLDEQGLPTGAELDPAEELRLQNMFTELAREIKLQVTQRLKQELLEHVNAIEIPE